MLLDVHLIETLYRSAEMTALEFPLLQITHPLLQKLDVVGACHLESKEVIGDYASHRGLYLTSDSLRERDPTTRAHYLDQVCTCSILRVSRPGTSIRSSQLRARSETTGATPSQPFAV